MLHSCAASRGSSITRYEVVPGVRNERGQRCPRLLLRVRAHLDEQPAGAVGQLGNAAAARPRNPLHEPRVQALDRVRLVGEHGHHGVGRGGHVWVREDNGEPMRGNGNQVARWPR